MCRGAVWVAGDGSAGCCGHFVALNDKVVVVIAEEMVTDEQIVLEREGILRRGPP